MESKLGAVLYYQHVNPLTTPSDRIDPSDRGDLR